MAKKKPQPTGRPRRLGAQKPPRRPSRKTPPTLPAAPPRPAFVDFSEPEPAPVLVVSPPPSEPPFTVVGVGASAGGLEAFGQLLTTLQTTDNLAVVFVQHLDPRHESLLQSLLSKETGLKVVQVTDGMAVEPGKVYVIPPNAEMGIRRGTLQLTERMPDGHHHPIDLFLTSLAEYAQAQAVGVILSGTGSDGAAGLREIKGVGGITIVQDPKLAKFDGMPRAAIATGQVDLVLPAAEIGRELARIAQHPARRPAPAQASRPAPAELLISSEQLHQLFFLLRGASGVDFTHYKQPTIRRRLQRRMVLHKITTVVDYLKLLQQNPAEAHALYQDILIHVTRFFREPETYDTLRDTVFPQITRHRNGEPVRIWVPGCSTGEEAYSVAIALLEYLGNDAANTAVQLFATDVSESAVEQARAGLYTDSILSDVSPDRLRRFFTKMDGTYRIAKSVRDLCVFARQDLTRDPSFSKLDLILCRNVLIYLGPVLQKKLMNVFHYALRPTGFLMLGGSETIGTHADLFVMADKRHKLYSKRAGALHTTLHLQAATDFGPNRVEPVPRKPSTEPRPGINIQNEANRVVLNRYAPPGVVVDGDLQIVQFRGQTGAYLEPAPGDASLNVLKMAREGLVYDLRLALNEARKSDAAVRREGLKVRVNGHTRVVNLDVSPLVVSHEDRLFLILFEHVTTIAPSAEPPPAPGKAGKKTGKKRVAPSEDERKILHLQHELAASREYLQSIIQDLEAANEELQSANEEILSSNEELQSTNEELDTAKEELQSTNEELNTVNEELQGRNEELGRVNGDLINLLGSVQIPIVMVSADLRIRRFTPMAEKVMNLIPSDVGRPIGDIKPNVEAPNLEELITESVDSVAIIEREVRDQKGHWYLMRIRPYKNVENKIDGAVVALFDLEGVQQADVAARDARDYAEAIVEAVRHPLVVLDENLKVGSVNQAFYDMFGETPGTTQNRFVFELGNGQWDLPELRQLLEDVLPANSRFDRYVVEHDFPKIGKMKLALSGRKINRPDGQPGLILLAIEDLTSAGNGAAKK